MSVIFQPHLPYRYQLSAISSAISSQLSAHGYQLIAISSRANGWKPKAPRAESEELKASLAQRAAAESREPKAESFTGSQPRPAVDARTIRLHSNVI
jgi:hypothetical protein